MPESLNIALPESVKIAYTELEPRPPSSRCVTLVLFFHVTLCTVFHSVPVEQGTPVEQILFHGS